ncbi:MAG: hypothetical protein M3O31_06745 [Acidobacteriota bacterium]|nr:hypothetical protein [Acidobacteriota bacterium]
MAKLGNNIKITTPRSAQIKLREMFVALETTLRSPDNDTDVSRRWVWHGRFCVYPNADALTVTQMRIAPWLEIAVDDPASAAEKLDALGLVRLTVAECRDGAHVYFVAPAVLYSDSPLHSRSETMGFTNGFMNSRDVQPLQQWHHKVTRASIRF